MGQKLSGILVYIALQRAVEVYCGCLLSLSQLWIQRINGAAQQHKISYSRFMNSLIKVGASTHSCEHGTYEMCGTLLLSTSMHIIVIYFAVRHSIEQESSL